jgi:pyruvate kinase
MARIIESAETGRKAETGGIERWIGKQSGRISRALCEAAAFAAEEVSAKTVAVLTESGLMARRMAALRPAQRIIALTPSKDVRNELALIWAVESLIHPGCESTEEMLRAGERTLLEAGIVQHGDLIVLMAGRLSGLGLSSSVTLYTVGGEKPPQQA